MTYSLIDASFYPTNAPHSLCIIFKSFLNSFTRVRVASKLGQRLDFSEGIVADASVRSMLWFGWNKHIKSCSMGTYIVHINFSIHKLIKLTKNSEKNHTYYFNPTPRISKFSG
jgi:hypothetical protein